MADRELDDTFENLKTGFKLAVLNNINKFSVFSALNDPFAETCDIIAYQVQGDEVVWGVEEQGLDLVVGELEEDEFVVGFDQEHAVRVHAEENVIA